MAKEVTYHGSEQLYERISELARVLGKDSLAGDVREWMQWAILHIWPYTATYSETHRVPQEMYLSAMHLLQKAYMKGYDDKTKDIR